MIDLRLRKASEIMTGDVLTIGAGESPRRAAALMSQHRVHCLLVPAEQAGRSVGVVTVKDIVQILSEGESSLLDQLLVRDAMTAPAISVQKDFAVGDCIRLMRMSGVRSVPVLDGVKLVGVLSFSDVLRVAAEESG